MDEAGHAVEPEALNTVAGKQLLLFSDLFLSYNINTKIVFSIFIFKEQI